MNKLTKEDLVGKFFTRTSKNNGYITTPEDNLYNGVYLIGYVGEHPKDRKTTISCYNLTQNKSIEFYWSCLIFERMCTKQEYIHETFEIKLI